MIDSLGPPHPYDEDATFNSPQFPPVSQPHLQRICSGDAVAAVTDERENGAAMKGKTKLAVNSSENQDDVLSPAGREAIEVDLMRRRWVRRSKSGELELVPDSEPLKLLVKLRDTFGTAMPAGARSRPSEPGGAGVGRRQARP
jgi:hypothetical protein